MAQKCLKCKNRISQDEFICPHCGAIIGDPVSYSASVQTRAGTPKHRLLLRWCFLVLLALIMVSAVATAAWFMISLANGQKDPAGNTTPPVTTVPVPTQTTAPLSVYTVRVQTESKTDITGTKIHICSGDQEIYTGMVQADGTATFILPEADGYSVRLSDLPVRYQGNYKDTYFPFEQGQRHLDVMLENKPVEFTFKFVNSSGEPVPGVSANYYSAIEGSQNLISDASGCCTFITEYVSEYQQQYVVIYFVPYGYIFGTDMIDFRLDKLEFVVTLSTYEEAGIDPQDVYTVRVVDEHGEPVPYITLSALSDWVDGSREIHNGTTNVDGSFSFAGSDRARYTVRINNVTDYYGAEFSFSEETRELLIELDMQKEPDTKYTYTVYFVDDDDQPVSDVTISVPSSLDGDGAEYYTSDEYGIVNFESLEADPYRICFFVDTVPDGYYSSLPDGNLYSFNAQRSSRVRLRYDGKVNYTVYVLDDTGAPAAYVGFLICGNDEIIDYPTADEQGIITLRYPADFEFNLTLSALPLVYADYVIDKIEYGAGHCIYITIAPSSEMDP